jgi:hypothetical protein
MYRLPQAGILAHLLLEERLNAHGYSQSKAVPGLWRHKSRPISFTLVNDDFGVKYVGKEHAMHLINILKETYEILEGWWGSKYVGSTFYWDYANRRVHLSMPGYINKALQRFAHERPQRLQNSPVNMIVNYSCIACSLACFRAWRVFRRNIIVYCAKQTQKHTFVNIPTPTCGTNIQSKSAVCQTGRTELPA